MAIVMRSCCYWWYMAAKIDLQIHSSADKALESLTDSKCNESQALDAGLKRTAYAICSKAFPVDAPAKAQLAPATRVEMNLKTLLDDGEHGDKSKCGQSLEV